MSSRGKKRGATSDDADDSPVKDKRLMTDFSQQQPPIAKPLFDEKRLEEAHVYVRALNSQFASWVQSQLQDHPDELWESGLQDYLAHSSSFLENFSDVVAYLKQKTTEVKDTSPAISSNQKIASDVVQQTESSKPDVQFQTDSRLGHDIAASGFTNSWNAGALFGSHTPVSSGNHASNTYESRVTEDIEEENELKKPSSPSVEKVKEKGIVIVHEVKCKIYLKPDDPAVGGWKDMGIGMLSIKCKEGVDKATKESKPTIIIRNDIGKVLLNASIYSGIRTTIQKNTLASIFHTLNMHGPHVLIMKMRWFALEFCCVCGTKGGCHIFIHFCYRAKNNCPL